MPRNTRTSAVRGVAPTSCPCCKRATVEKDYRWRTNGACHRTCKLCEDRVRIAERDARRKRKESRKSWAIWRKVISD